MSLPIYQSDSKEMSMMQTAWASELNPLLSNPMLAGRLLRNVALVSGDNTINHKLGRKLQGWLIVRKRAAADIYDKQDNNTMPDLTLVLNASTAVVVDIYCF